MQIGGEDIGIQSLPVNELVDVGYYDDDMLIIDNVKSFIEPSFARITTNFIVVCTKGKSVVEVNGESLQLEANHLLVGVPNVTLSNFMVSLDFEFKAFLFTNRLLQRFLHEKVGLWNELMYARQLHVMPIEEENVRLLKKFYDILQIIFKEQDDNPFRTDIIQSLLRGVFLRLCGLLNLKRHERQSQAKSSDMLFLQFLKILGEMQVKHQPVDFFARALCITSKNLTQICKKNSGKTASEWITEHVLEDIRYYLKHTDLGLKQICDRLGFSNPSFFGKYVKRHFGVTPIELRNR